MALRKGKRRGDRCSSCMWTNCQQDKKKIRPSKGGEEQMTAAALLNNRLFRLPELLSQGQGRWVQEGGAGRGLSHNSQIAVMLCFACSCMFCLFTYSYVLK